MLTEISYWTLFADFVSELYEVFDSPFYFLNPM